MSKSSDKQFAALSENLDGLLGPVEEWSAEEVDQFLSDAGIDMQAAARTLYSRVSEIAGAYHERNQNVPEPVAELLRQMRPIDVPLRDPKEAKGVARKWLAGLRRARPQLTVPQVAHAFRNKKGQLTANDQEVLDRLEAQLLSGRRKENDDQ